MHGFQANIFGFLNRSALAHTANGNKTSVWDLPLDGRPELSISPARSDQEEV
jgi:hypothetical protein